MKNAIDVYMDDSDIRTVSKSVLKSNKGYEFAADLDKYLAVLAMQYNLTIDEVCQLVGEYLIHNYEKECAS